MTADGRVIRTPEQRAKDSLAAANAARDRAERARNVAKVAAGAAQREYERLLVLAEYAAKHPDLPVDGPAVAG